VQCRGYVFRHVTLVLPASPSQHGTPSNAMNTGKRHHTFAYRTCAVMLELGWPRARPHRNLQANSLRTHPYWPSLKLCLVQLPAQESIVGMLVRLARSVETG
jgi:hypothetical protein